MIGLDTNVVLRLLVDDGGAQFERARRFVEKNCTPDSPGLINNVVLVETVWVLESVHGYGRADIQKAIARLLMSPGIAFEDGFLVGSALDNFASRGVDFADALLGEINGALGCTATATFDRKAAKLDGFVLVK
jgi:predicted nucleic-acid-binding protein